MAKVQLDIVTPSKRVLSKEVDEVTIPGVLGEFGILPMHTPFLTTLGIGALTLGEGRKKTKYVINGGYAEISQDKIIVLTETCEAADSIDLKRAKHSLTQAQKALLELDANSPQYQEEWARAKRAQARVEVAENAI